MSTQDHGRSKNTGVSEKKLTTWLNGSDNGTEIQTQICSSLAETSEQVKPLHGQQHGKAEEIRPNIICDVEEPQRWSHQVVNVAHFHPQSR